MPRVVFSIDPKEIAKRCIRYLIKQEYFKKMGYYLKLPELPEEIVKDLKESEDLIKKNKYDATKYFKAFEEAYNKKKHEFFMKQLEEKWKKIEKQFFENVEKIIGKKWLHEEYTCYCSFYGPGGSYSGDSVIIVADRPDAERILAHELIHTLIHSEIITDEIPHWTKERIVDLYLAKTELRKLFDHPPRIQHASKEMKVDEIFEKSTKIKDIIKELKATSS